MTKLLSSERFAQASAFLLEDARPLEAAIFRYRFEGGDADSIYSQLAQFQNADGGFGQALEPDLRTPVSSVLATTTALQHLRMLHTPALHPLASGAVAFLMSTYDPNLESWPLAPAQADESPHAPWWSQEGLADRFARFAINPRAEVLGYLYEFADENDVQTVALRELLTPVVMAGLLEHTDNLSSNEFLACQRLVDSPGLPGEAAVALQRWLLRMAETAVATDPATWSGYVLMPLQVAPNHIAPMGTPLAHLLPQNLDFVIDNQAADGSWSPAWSWMGEHPAAWPQAEREWRGVLTLERLVWLNAYDRIEKP